MQKELHGDVTRGRKNVRDARKAAMQRVKIATDTTLRKIEENEKAQIGVVISGLSHEQSNLYAQCHEKGSQIS